MVAETNQSVYLYTPEVLLAYFKSMRTKRHRLKLMNRLAIRDRDAIEIGLLSSFYSMTKYVNDTILDV